MKLKMFTLFFDEAQAAFDGSEREGLHPCRTAVAESDHFHVCVGTPGSEHPESVVP